MKFIHSRTPTPVAVAMLGEWQDQREHEFHMDMEKLLRKYDRRGLETRRMQRVVEATSKGLKADITK